MIDKKSIANIIYFGLTSNLFDVYVFIDFLYYLLLIYSLFLFYEIDD